MCYLGSRDIRYGLAIAASLLAGAKQWDGTNASLVALVLVLTPVGLVSE